MSPTSKPSPDSTAVRVALWRALHTLVDARPWVFEDEMGLKLAAPEAEWRARPDMNPEFTQPFRASIVGRARFIEDLVVDNQKNIRQYVLLGAGLDTFAQRRLDVAGDMQIFEVDQPGPQAWKRQRLEELGLKRAAGLHFVPVNFETDSWWEKLKAEGFDPKRPAIVASTGVSMYLTREANSATLHTLVQLAPGSQVAMSYLLPLELTAPELRHGRELAERGARASGTPFISFFSSPEMRALALDSGFKEATTITAADLNARYFRNRTDGLRLADAEEILLAKT